MRKVTHNRTEFFKPTEAPKEHIRKLEDVSAEQKLHQPMYDKIATYYNRHVYEAKVIVEHYRTMKYKHVIYYLYNSEFEKIGEYTMFYAVFQLAKSKQPFYISKQGFTFHDQPIKKVA